MTARTAPSLLVALTLSACASPARRPTARPTRREPAPVAARPLPDGVTALAPLDDGLTASRLSDGALVVTDHDGRELSRRLVDPAARCALYPWRARVFARCAVGDVALVEETSPRVAVARGEVFASRDGTTLAKRGPCNSGETPTTDVTLTVACSWTAERGWREWTAPGDGDVLDVHGSLALLVHRARVERADGQGEVVADLRLYDVDNGRFVPMRLPDPASRWVRAGFTRSGRIVGLARTGTARAPQGWRVSGLPGGPLRAAPLPRAFDDFDLSDDDRGVYTACAEALVTDGSGAWSRALTPAAEAPPSCGDAPAEPRRYGERVRCGSARCVVDGAVTVDVDRRRGLGL
ncbi:MAG: hypothetical protein R3A52_22590 [Polyangiales bacterium]